MEDQEEAYIASRPNTCPKRAAKIFKNINVASDIFSELPSKKHKGGGLSSIDVPIPRIGPKLEYQTIPDLILIEKLILRRNILHF